MRLLILCILFILVTLSSILIYKNSDVFFNKEKQNQQTNLKKIETLTLKGSNTIGEDFAPLLAVNFLKSIGAVLIHNIPQNEPNQKMIEGFLQSQNKTIQIDIQAHGSTTGFKALKANTTQIAMSSRAIKQTEKQDLVTQFIHVSEHPIALDALAIVTFKNNPIEKLTIEQISSIFSGEITNWKELNGPDLPVQLFSRDNNSGTWDTFKTLVLKAYDKELAVSSLRFESSNQLVNEVINTEGSIGFVGVSYIGDSKLIAISKEIAQKAQVPSMFTIGTQNYPLSRKLYLYTVGNDLTPLAQSFLNFCSQNAGQKLAENVGLVSYYPTQQRPILTEKNIPRRYQDLFSMGSRITVDFSLDDESDHAKESRDILRLQHYIEQNPVRKIVLVDFANSSNTLKIKDKLAQAELPVLDILQINFEERAEKNKLEVWIL